MLVAKIKPYAAILFFGFFLLVGLFTVDHYGMSWDEDMEHLTSYVQYKYALGKLRIVELEDYEQLWRDFGGEKYYGQAISFPLLIVEHLFNFQLDSRPVYLARHTYNFLIFWTAGIFLYAALKKLFSSRKVAFFGVLLWFLCPRFWGESFYNNKDLLFCSLMMMSMSSAYLWSRKWGWGAGILWAIVTAFMVNLRIIGLFAVLFEGVYLLKELLSISFASWRVASGGGPPKTQNTLLRSKLRLIVRRERDASSSGVGVSRPNEQSSRSEAKAVFWVFFKMLICTIIFYITYVAIFPTAWRDPLGIWFDVYQLMRNYPMGMFIIFLGQSIHNTALPWHYLPVYFFATMPLLFSALLLFAVFFIIKKFKSISINLF
ncbi:hypothetical protein FWH30_02535, partial [Microgenomates group bacterium]|nr:hypothetical protein [Microgenomates group bacterium]